MRRSSLHWVITLFGLLPPLTGNALEWQGKILFKDLSGAAGWSAAKDVRQLADVNGDGRADLVGFSGRGVHVAFGDGSDFSRPRLVLRAYGAQAGGWRKDRHPRLLGDVDGDGRDDVVAFGHHGVYLSRGTGRGFAAPIKVYEHLGYKHGWRIDRHPRLLADVNGDGRADIVGFGNAGTYLALSNGKGFERPRLVLDTYGYDQGWRVDRHPRLLADVNGDGREDIVGFANAGTYLALSTGTGFENRKALDAFGYKAGNWRVERHPRMLADVDGDGRADVVGFGNAGVFVARSTGTGFTPLKRWIKFYGYRSGSMRVDKHPRYLADVNGDGRADVIGFGNTRAVYSLSTGRSFARPETLIGDMGYNQGWRVGVHDRLVADLDGNGTADVVGFGPAATKRVLAHRDAPSTTDRTVSSGNRLQLPPQLHSVLPTRGIQLEQDGEPVTVRAEGLSLQGAEVEILYRNATIDAINARVTSSTASSMLIELRASARAPTGTGYALRLRNATALSEVVPIAMEVRPSSAFRQPVVTVATTPPTAQRPPISSWTKPGGAASGSTLEFLSASGFDDPALPDIDKLQLRLGEVPLIVLDREPDRVRAKIPFAPLPTTRASLPLTASYLGVDNSTRVLDPAFRLDPTYYDPRQAEVVAVRRLSGDPGLDDLPFSRAVGMEFTVADFPFTQIRLSDVFLVKTSAFIPNDCLSQLIRPRTDPRVRFTRAPDGTIRVVIPVFSLGSCVPTPAGRSMLEFRNVPISQYRVAERPTLATTDLIFANNAVPLAITTSTPETVTVEDTWALRDLFDPGIGSQFGRCQGTVEGQPVGVHEFGGDLAFSARSGTLGTECVFFTYRLRAREGIRFGTVGRLPVSQPRVTFGAIDIEEVVG